MCSVLLTTCFGLVALSRLEVWTARKDKRFLLYTFHVWKIENTAFYRLVLLLLSWSEKAYKIALQSWLSACSILLPINDQPWSGSVVLTYMSFFVIFLKLWFQLMSFIETVDIYFDNQSIFCTNTICRWNENYCVLK